MTLKSTNGSIPFTSLLKRPIVFYKKLGALLGIFFIKPFKCKISATLIKEYDSLVVTINLLPLGQVHRILNFSLG